MLKLYKDLLFCYYVVAFLGMMFLLWMRESFHKAILFLLMVLWVYLVMILFNLFAVRRLNKVQKLLDDCRLRQAATAYEKMLKRNATTNILSFVKINLSAAYCGMGEVDDGREILSDTLILGKGALAAQLRPIKENNLAALDCLENCLNRAEDHLNQCETLLEAKRISKETREATARACEDNRAVIALKRKNYPAAETLFTQRLTENISRREQVAAHWWLAEICDKTDRPQEATEHYRFCAEKGGDTWQAEKANERMDEE